MSTQNNLFKTTFVPRGAIFSPDRKYRYFLHRFWGTGPWVSFVCLNPSKADEEEDDNTVKRCINYARLWGFDGLIVANIFAFRATNPIIMKAQDDPIGPDNNKFLTNFALRNSAVIVAAWGNDGLFRDRANEVVRLFKKERINLYYLKLTLKGQPYHPLYLKNSLKPIQWNI